jgi:hypothetical protein
MIDRTRVAKSICEVLYPAICVALQSKNYNYRVNKVLTSVNKACNGLHAAALVEEQRKEQYDISQIRSNPVTIIPREVHQTLTPLQLCGKAMSETPEIFPEPLAIATIKQIDQLHKIEMHKRVIATKQLELITATQQQCTTPASLEMGLRLYFGNLTENAHDGMSHWSMCAGREIVRNTVIRWIGDYGAKANLELRLVGAGEYRSEDQPRDTEWIWRQLMIFDNYNTKRWERYMRSIDKFTISLTTMSLLARPIIQGRASTAAEAATPFFKPLNFQNEATEGFIVLSDSRTTRAAANMQQSHYEEGTLAIIEAFLSC